MHYCDKCPIPDTCKRLRMLDMSVEGYGVLDESGCVLEYAVTELVMDRLGALVGRNKVGLAYERATFVERHSKQRPVRAHPPIVGEQTLSQAPGRSRRQVARA